MSLKLRYFSLLYISSYKKSARALKYICMLLRADLRRTAYKIRRVGYMLDLQASELCTTAAVLQSPGNINPASSLIQGW